MNKSEGRKHLTQCVVSNPSIDHGVATWNLLDRKLETAGPYANLGLPRRGAASQKHQLNHQIRARYVYIFSCIYIYIYIRIYMEMLLCKNVCTCSIPCCNPNKAHGP